MVPQTFDTSYKPAKKKKKDLRTVQPHHRRPHLHHRRREKQRDRRKREDIKEVFNWRKYQHSVSDEDWWWFPGKADG